MSDHKIGSNGNAAIIQQTDDINAVTPVEVQRLDEPGDAALQGRRKRETQAAAHPSYGGGVNPALVARTAPIVPQQIETSVVDAIDDPSGNAPSAFDALTAKYQSRLLDLLPEDRKDTSGPWYRASPCIGSGLPIQIEHKRDPFSSSVEIYLTRQGWQERCSDNAWGGKPRTYWKPIREELCSSIDLHVAENHMRSHLEEASPMKGQYQEPTELPYGNDRLPYGDEVGARVSMFVYSALR